DLNEKSARLRNSRSTSRIIQRESEMCLWNFYLYLGKGAITKYLSTSSGSEIVHQMVITTAPQITRLQFEELCPYRRKSTAWPRRMLSLAFSRHSLFSTSLY